MPQRQAGTDGRLDAGDERDPNPTAPWAPVLLSGRRGLWGRTMLQIGRLKSGRTSARGFTLLELMVVVGIVAIIAAIALPSYQEQIRKSRRADAARAVGQIQLGLERWRAENPCYGTTPNPPCASLSGTYPNVDSFDSEFYDISLPTATASTFVVRATPIGAQSDDRCGTLELNESGSGKPTWGTAACN